MFAPNEKGLGVARTYKRWGVEAAQTIFRETTSCAIPQIEEKFDGGRPPEPSL